MAKMMKDSGVKWIGTIPEDWKTIKIKYTSWLKGRIGWQGLKSNEYQEEGAHLITGVDFMDGTINWDSCVCISEERFNEAPEIHIKEGDLLITKDGTIGKVAIAKNCPKQVSLNSGVLLIRNTKDFKYHDKYLYYVLLSDEFWTWYEMSQTGNSTIRHLYQEQFYNFEFSFPKIEEQEKIAAFLDGKVKEIDAIISKTRESIEEYKKYKQAVITEVAIGGLDKAVTTKNSGIDWIGNIPEHWKIKPFKFVMTERNEKNIPVKTDERLALSIDKGITTYAEKTTNLDRFKDDVTQYKLAYEGDLVFNSMNMIVGAIGYSNYFGCVSPVYYTYYDNVEGHYTSKYYEYIFRSKTMRKVLFSLGKGIMAIDRGDDKINTCRLKVSRDDLRCLKVPVPTEQEQQEIVKYLDAKCAEIDALIAKKEAFVEEMEAYKKSLIYEYVTGKKEV